MTARPLAGAVLLVEGDSVALALSCYRLAARMGQRDGIAPSAGLRALIGAAEAAVAEGVFRDRNVLGAAEYRAEGDVSASDADGQELVEIDVRKAAEMLGVTERAVRGLCLRGALESARRGRGGWVVSQAEVMQRLELRRAG